MQKPKSCGDKLEQDTARGYKLSNVKTFKEQIRVDIFLKLELLCYNYQV